jgi:hypothetical protein
MSSYRGSPVSCQGDVNVNIIKLLNYKIIKKDAVVNICVTVTVLSTPL